MTSNIKPARLHTSEVAKVLGFPEHDIPVLVSRKLLKPLGKPAQSAPKYYAACEIEKLAIDSSWLNKATQTVYDYWKVSNAKRRGNRPPVLNEVQKEENETSLAA